MKFRPRQIRRLVLLAILACGMVRSTPVPAAAHGDPSTRPADDLRVWFKQLSDPRPDVREHARISLLTIPRARLVDLKTVVTESRPLSAAQAVEIRQIVEHVFLSGESYLSEPRGRGFLGVQLAEISVPESENSGTTNDGAERDITRVMIASRFPGFNAYAMLRDGDVLVSIVGSNTPLTGFRDLQQAMIGADPGTIIELEVQRAGRLIRVPVRLSPRPIFLKDANQAMENSTAFGVEREDAANKYWEENFAKLLDQQTL
jgi:hypothetical protein